MLYQDDLWPERIQLEHWEPGARAPFHNHPELVELFVLEGTFEDEYSRYPAGTWIRAPVGSSHAPFSTAGCRLYTKVGMPTMGCGGPRPTPLAALQSGRGRYQIRPWE